MVLMMMFVDCQTTSIYRGGHPLSIGFVSLVGNPDVETMCTYQIIRSVSAARKGKSEVALTEHH